MSKQDISQRAHRASDRGGFGVRMFNHDREHWANQPSGSSLNCYSMGDVVCWDTREEAEEAAREYMKHGLYKRCEVEPVVKGQHQMSIAEEREEIRVKAAFAAGQSAERAAVVKWLRELPTCTINGHSNERDYAERVEAGEHVERDDG